METQWLPQHPQCSFCEFFRKNRKNVAKCDVLCAIAADSWRIIGNFTSERVFLPASWRILGNFTSERPFFPASWRIFGNYQSERSFSQPIGSVFDVFHPESPLFLPIGSIFAVFLPESPLFLPIGNDFADCLPEGSGSGRKNEKPTFTRVQWGFLFFFIIFVLCLLG